MFGEVIARLAVEPAGNPEIDQRESAVGLDEDIAGVQIGMKKTVAEDLSEKNR